MKTLCLAKYPHDGPSSRYRLYQFLPFLEAAGVEAEVQTLHTDDYLRRRYRGERAGAGYLAARVLSRLTRLAGVKHYHVLLVQKEIFPHAPGVVEALLERMGVKVVLDLDDAIHLPYRGTRLQGKIARVIARADLVLAGNRYLADYARGHNHAVVHFPTVVDTDHFTPSPSLHHDDEPAGAPVVGWIGSPATSDYLRARLPELAAAARQSPFSLRVVGDPALQCGGLSVDARGWSLDTEADELRSMDIGVMPLPDDEWAEGKCALKLLQYMSAGLATVSSPTGAVRDIVEDGVDGFIASTPEEWRERVARLAADPGLRRRMGQAARRRVCDHYSLSAYGPRLPRYLQAVARGEAVDDG
jgi:glycosyltransferase involved in cell wall biosynthesis